MSISRDIVRRNPFRIGSVPTLSVLQRAAYRQRRRTSKRFIGKPAKKIFRLAHHHLKIGGQGSFYLEVNGSESSFNYNARNTQFGALFMPQTAEGYEPELTALLDIIVGDRDTFFDVGANWGFFSLYVLSRPGYSGQVHAFEPYPETFQDLSSIAAQSPFAERFGCHDCGLSDRNEAGQMGLIDDIQSGLARLSASDKSADVELRSLDQLEFGPPDIIKIDVEGHEGEVMQGGQKIFSTHHPMTIFESWLEPDQPEITMNPFKVLEDLGYIFYLPCWQSNIKETPYALMDAPEDSTNRKTTFSLIEFESLQRFLLPRQINVFACHESKLNDLEILFRDES